MYKPINYEYIGPKEILNSIKPELQGTKIESSKEIVNWLKLNNKITKAENFTVCTFIIDLKGHLLISDRHSEHVQCAFGENVLSAGEIGFKVESQERVKVESLTNLSTGYCPPPKSWSEVYKTLIQIEGLIIPKKFEPSYIFSYCSQCKQRQIIKDDFYYCPICEKELLSGEEFQKRRNQLDFE